MKKQNIQENIFQMNNTKNRNGRKLEVLKNNSLKNSLLIVLLLMVSGLLPAGCQANPQAKSAVNNLTENKAINVASNKKVIPDVSEQDKQIVEEAVANFHKLYNQRKFEEIYALMDENVKTLIKKDAFIGMLEKSSNELRKVKKANLVEINASDEKEFTSIEMLYDTDYEGKVRQERFKWVIREGVAKLLFYSHPPKKALMMLGKQKN